MQLDERLEVYGVRETGTECKKEEGILSEGYGDRGLKTVMEEGVESQTEQHSDPWTHRNFEKDLLTGVCTRECVFFYERWVNHQGETVRI